MMDRTGRSISDAGNCGRVCVFAGGGTGGHIYPGLAVAEELAGRDENAEIHFLCSSGNIDSHILSKSEFDYIPLAATGFSLRPDRLLRFCFCTLASYYQAVNMLKPVKDKAIVIGTGGYVSAAVIPAARRLGIPIFLLNIDAVAGKTNKLLAHMAHRIFVQFDQTAKQFGGSGNKVMVAGCPLRGGFAQPDGKKAQLQLGLDENKKTLVVTGASSGAVNINNAICGILHQLSEFADDWQVVHLCGKANYDTVRATAGYTKINYKVADYYDEMADLYALADLVVGRSGAVSIAEYAASGTASICIPYPYHKDRQQYLNAQILVEAGAAVVVEDAMENMEKTSEQLLRELRTLMREDNKRREMGAKSKSCAVLNAAAKIADVLLAE